MDASSQQLFNIVVAVAGALGGWWMNVMWEGLKDSQEADRAMGVEVSDLKVLVVGGYVSTASLDKMTQAIFTKLDRIEDKLDGKADK